MRLKPLQCAAAALAGLLLAGSALAQSAPAPKPAAPAKAAAAAKKARVPLLVEQRSAPDIAWVARLGAAAAIACRAGHGAGTLGADYQ